MRFPCACIAVSSNCASVFNKPMENEKQAAEIFRSARDVRLSAEEKTFVRSRLIAFIEALPSRSPSPTPSLLHSFTFLRFRQHLRNRLVFIPKFAPALAVLLLSVSASGAAYAAEGALPGDFLYPLKVRVNEEARSALALSPQAKAEWEARRAERRLEEAEKLAALSRLDPEAGEAVEESFVSHAEKVNERIADLESDDEIEAAAELSSRLESAIDGHDEVLAALADRAGALPAASAEDDDKERSGVFEAQAMAALVAGEKAAASALRSRLEDGLPERAGRTAAGRARWEASEEIRSASGKTKKTGGPDAAEELLRRGDGLMDSGDFDEAVSLFREARGAAKKARLSAEAKAEWGIELEDADGGGGD